jgi:hypothetical protein
VPAPKNPAPLSREDSLAKNRLRWRTDPQGLAKHVAAIVNRAPALTADQVERLRAALAELPDPGR